MSRDNTCSQPRCLGVISARTGALLSIASMLALLVVSITGYLTLTPSYASRSTFELVSSFLVLIAFCALAWAAWTRNFTWFTRLCAAGFFSYAVIAFTLVRSSIEWILSAAMHKGKQPVNDTVSWSIIAAVFVANLLMVIACGQYGVALKRECENKEFELKPTSPGQA